MHPADARARLLFEAVCEPTVAGRLADVGEELRVARLIAHMRPYLPSSQAARTQPMQVVIPAQRGVADAIEQRRLDGNVRRLEAHYRAVAARRDPPTPSTPYSGGTR